MNENLHLLALIIDTFDHILYCVDYINPNHAEVQRMYSELDELPTDIYAGMIENIESKAGTYEEVMQEFPQLGNYVKLNHVKDILV